MRNIAADNIADLESIETSEWLDSLDYVLQSNGPARAGQLLLQLSEHARRRGIRLPFTANTPYVNTLTTDQEVPFPGSQEIERRIKSLVRWNAIAMVLRANKNEPGIGGHISTFASAATLYEVGFNHFFRAGNAGDRDVVYYQGHAAPGIYSRAFLEGRLTEKQLDNFRRELAPGGGLSSYPHPWLMPDFWEYPTVSMGLGPIMAIYQARFIRYLEDRGLKKPSNSKVWAFLGDGETDEPESLGAITLPAREKLDNLIFVVNCNLQRLDGPVRGNGQIIQELEAVFRGAGWNVIKVLWGKDWDPLLAKDKDGLLVKRMGEIVDGEYQKYTVESGRVSAQAFLGQVSAAARDGQAPLGRRAEEADARRARSGQGLQRLQSRGRAQGAADGPAHSHHQGLRAWRRGAKARTSPISRRSSPKTSCALSASVSAFRFPKKSSARRRTTGPTTRALKSPI